jgi:hypothetical protein
VIQRFESLLRELIQDDRVIDDDRHWGRIIAHEGTRRHTNRKINSATYLVLSSQAWSTNNMFNFSSAACGFAESAVHIHRDEIDSFGPHEVAFWPMAV